MVTLPSLKIEYIFFFLLQFCSRELNHQLDFRLRQFDFQLGGCQLKSFINKWPIRTLGHWSVQPVHHIFLNAAPKIPIKGNSGSSLVLFKSDTRCFPRATCANLSLKHGTAKKSWWPEYFCIVHLTSGWGREKFHFSSHKGEKGSKMHPRHSSTDCTSYRGVLRETVGF